MPFSSALECTFTVLRRCIAGHETYTELAASTDFSAGE